MEQVTDRDFLCIGHRGAMGHAPENTLASVRKALELGVHGVEVDVYHVDGRLVVFHDDRLERTTNGAGSIHGQTFEYLRSLDAGNGERIPTLAEVLDTIDRKVCVNVELKGPSTARPVVECIDAFRDRGWRDDLFLVSSFDHRELAEVRRVDPLIKIGVLLAGPPVDDTAIESAIGAYSVHPSAAFVDRRFVDDAHAHGLRVFVFTVDHPDEIVRVHRLGADGIFTNYPERVLRRFPSGDGTPGWR